MRLTLRKRLLRRWLRGCEVGLRGFVRGADVLADEVVSSVAALLSQWEDLGGGAPQALWVVAAGMGSSE
jgi:hypothetical protein